MPYPNPTPATGRYRFFEYDVTSAVVIRPLEEEVWSNIRLLRVEEVCLGQLRQRRSSTGRRGRLSGIASNIRSCVTQAEEYFWLALKASPRAAPLLHYYSMLNLTKALVYLEAPRRLERDRDLLHGLTDPKRVKKASATFALDRERLIVKGGVFRSLYYVLTGEEIARQTSLNIMELLRYCTWVTNEVESIGIMCRLIDAGLSIAEDTGARRVWLTAEIDRDYLRRHCGSIETFESEAPSFTQVFGRVRADHPGQLKYESNPIPYATGRAQSAAISDLRRNARPLRLYRHIRNDDSETAAHMIPLDSDGGRPLPEPCVLLAIAFYLGSLVRYQPHVYDYLLGTEEAWLLEAFVRQCPLAFSYSLLNHFWRTEHLFS